MAKEKLAEKQSKLVHHKPTKEERLTRSFEKKRRGDNRKGGGGRDVGGLGSRSGNFSFETIHGFKMIDVEYKVPPMDVRKKLRRQFGEEGGPREQFLKYIGEHCVDQLRMIMNDSQIAEVKSGHTPNGYNTHHKLPIHGGGKNEFSNFVICPIPPHDDLHHDVIDPQIKNIGEGQSRNIKLPWTDSMVYVPTNVLEGHVPEKDYETCGRNVFKARGHNKLGSEEPTNNASIRFQRSPSMDHDIEEVYQEHVKERKAFTALKALRNNNRR